MKRIHQRLTEQLSALAPDLSASTDTTPLRHAQELGVEPSVIATAVANALGIDHLPDLMNHSASPSFVEHIPIHFARRHHLIGLQADGPMMPVAMADWSNWRLLDVIGRMTGCAVEPVLAPTSAIEAAINAAYEQVDNRTQTLIEGLDQKQVLAEVEHLEQREDLLDVSDRAPVIKLVNLVLFEAVKGQASDVHVQPYENVVKVRTRIDGVLFDAFDIPKSHQEEVISRLKVMGKMDIAEKRLPQDGRASVQLGHRVIDLRLASLPTSYGERIVIRLLDKSAKLFTLEELGMAPGCFTRFKRLIQNDHGLILVTGPTGSGKTTTLYAALQQIDAKQRNILTLEDPIEYQLDGVSQTQINEKKGMTFASGLRSVLRQDPDIIMVGEIRDHATAVMAIQSALTGHLVFSTLHTNDAASAVTRLLDLGIEPYLVASSVIGVLAQRLVRRNCAQCARPYTSTDEDLLRLRLNYKQIADQPIQAGIGCSACRESGYRGRVGIFELMVTNDEMRQLVQERSPASNIKAAAVCEGMQTLMGDGVNKMLTGSTSIPEVIRMASSFES